MKVSNISKLFCAAALSLSLASFTNDKKNGTEENANAVVFDAAIYKVAETNKVRLSVNKPAHDKLRVLLKDQSGKVYYSEVYNDNDAKYRRVFDLEEMRDGTYYFELFNKKDKLVKKVEIHSTNEKLISLR
jgi:hypothetical protein